MTISPTITTKMLEMFASLANKQEVDTPDGVVLAPILPLAAVVPADVLVMRRRRKTLALFDVRGECSVCAAVDLTVSRRDVPWGVSHA